MRQLFEDSKTLRPLRPRQVRAIEEIRAAVREGHRRIVLQAPTGFGKTLVSAHMISNAAARGNRPLFTCPAITLVNQTLHHFENEGIKDIGVIQAQHERTDFDAQVQIASVQTLIRRALPEVHFVLIDECHLQFKKLNAVLDSEEWKDKIVIGLSATPWTKGMGLRWTKLIIAATIQELIDEKLLSHFVIYTPKKEAQFSKLKTKLGEFTEESSAVVMGDKSIVADVVKTWIEKGPGDRTFLFAVNRAHARRLQEEFIEQGISCGYIDAYTDGDERKEVFKRFRCGEFKVIASVGCLTTGVDEDVRCIIDAQPTRDEKKHVQKIGRGLRIAEGKYSLLILDHAGNTLRLGMVTDIQHDHLDKRKPGDKGDAYSDEVTKPKPKKCSNCGAVIQPGKPVCNFCFHKIEVDHGVETEEGELVLFQSSPKKKAASGLDEQDWYSGFLGLAKERGYKTQWADHRFKEKFGDFPVRLRKEPKAPTIAIRAFDHHQRIKRAKSNDSKPNIEVAAR
jgi:superfamily II DNA or RNA helicase